jgi:hypothetical protein
MSTDINLLWPLKAAFDAIVDFRRALTEVCPFFRVFEETVLVCLFRCPDNTCGSARSVETGVRLVTLVRLAELTMDRRTEFYNTLVPAAYNMSSSQIIKT